MSQKRWILLYSSSGSRGVCLSCRHIFSHPDSSCIKHDSIYHVQNLHKASSSVIWHFYYHSRSLNFHSLDYLWYSSVKKCLFLLCYGRFNLSVVCMQEKTIWFQLFWIWKRLDLREITAHWNRIRPSDSGITAVERIPASDSKLAWYLHD